MVMRVAYWWLTDVKYDGLAMFGGHVQELPEGRDELSSKHLGLVSRKLG